MEVINEKIEMYKDLENQIGRRYGIKLDEILELAKIGQQNKDESLNALGYAYALGFKRGRSCEKNKRKRAKETSEKDTYNEKKELKRMNDDKAVELINEWLELAKEVCDMNLNRMDYDETKYNKAIQRIEEIRVQVAEYNEHKHEN